MVAAKSFVRQSHVGAGRMSDDPAHDYEILRVSTAQMLGLDLANLSPAEGLRLDLTVLLRLQLDALQGLALAGQDIDLSRLQSCYVMLSKLLPQAVEAPPEAREDHSARDKVRRLIEGYVTAREHEENERVASLEAEIAELQTRLSEKDAVIAALGGATVAATSPTPPASPPPPAPPQQTSPQPPLQSSSAPYVRCDGGVVEGGRKWWGPIGESG
jgi:hypothetical protein